MPIRTTEEACEDCRAIKDERLRKKLLKKLEHYSRTPPSRVEKNIEFRGYIRKVPAYRLKLNGERVLFLWPDHGELQIVFRIFARHEEYERTLARLLD